jgi:hypothetical protein
MFIKRGKTGTIIVVLYVDDMLIGAASVQEIDDVKQQLGGHFNIKDLGAARYILGMELEYDQRLGRMFIGQSQLVLRLTEKFNQQSARDAHVPILVGEDLSIPKAENDAVKMTDRPYRSLVGSLLYIATCTRPDIAFVVSKLSRHLEAPNSVHWKAAIRVLRYLRTTCNVGINYRSMSSGLNICAFSDSDWANQKDDRKSTSGVIVLMCGGPVIYKSRLQRTVALSTAEAEYMALALCVQEVVWIRSVLSELGIDQQRGTDVFVDNQSALAIAKNVGYQSRAKHIDIRYHFVRYHVSRGDVVLQYVPSNVQLADMMTKPIARTQFVQLISRCGVSVSRLRGSVDAQPPVHSALASTSGYRLSTPGSAVETLGEQARVRSQPPANGP